ncbi:MAG: efflux RND transporter periplasmic adaptor subunit [Gammaproteobacteria bacterium]|nr:efflux RND transporter periplasmic adaptor subunit [Gammaproteobacteria bacterium]
MPIQQPKRFRKLGMLLSIFIAILVLLFAWQYIRNDMAQQFAKSSRNPVEAVELGAVSAAVWYPQVSAIGTVKAEQGTDVSAEVAGKVKKIGFESGQLVKQGQVLLQLDDAGLKADVANAQANYDLSKSHFARINNVFKRGAVSKDTYDDALTAMQANQATLDKATALLNQATISAPFDGKIGLRQVSLGQYLAAGTAIANLEQINPVYVDFDLPEATLSEVKIGDTIDLTVASYPDKKFTGTIIASNAALSSSTRVLSLRAEVTNLEGLLIPGMFAQVNVVIPIPQNVLTVPEMAINYSPFGDAIFKVVNGKAQQIYVSVGEQRASDVAITGNIQANDIIVTSGVFKLQDGTPVKVVSQPQVKTEKRPGTVPKTIKRVPTPVVSPAAATPAVTTQPQVKSK